MNYRFFAVASIGLLFLAAFSNLSRAAELKLLTQTGYMPSLPVLVRVEVRGDDNRRDWDLWDAEAILAVDDPNVTLSTNRIHLYNGLGSAQVSFGGGTNFVLTATLGTLEATRRLENLTDAPVTSIGGVLPGPATVWSGVIRVTNDVTVQAGNTLTIESNTLVLVNGVASGTAAADLLINGAIFSQGTETHPVMITCASSNLNWGQIRHNNADPSVYTYTSITRAGRAPVEGHTGSGPAIRPTNSRITFQSCNITDLSVGNPRNTIGKIMFANGGANAALIFDDCLLARARMGPEITGSAVLFTNSYITEMFGADDADGIYLQQQNAGQEIILVDSVVAHGEDDGIDTLGSTISIERCIVRDWDNPNEDAKGVTVFSGETRIRDSLVVNCAIAVSTKSSGTGTAFTRIDRSTIQGLDRAVAAENKGGGAPDATVIYYVTNSILHASRIPTNSVYTDYDPANIHIYYSDVGEDWPGPGNINADPLFVNALTNFHLQANSPAIDVGDPDSGLDPDGTRADLGARPLFQVSAPVLSVQKIAADVLRIAISGTSGQVYELERTGDFSGWDPVQMVTNVSGAVEIDVSVIADIAHRFYRVRTLPASIPPLKETANERQ